jgi:hypothetical protein
MNYKEKCDGGEQDAGGIWEEKNYMQIHGFFYPFWHFICTGQPPAFF